MYSQQGQPCSPGGSGPETCAHTLREPGEAGELLQDASGRRGDSPAAGGQAQGLLDKTEAGSPVSCGTQKQTREPTERDQGSGDQWKQVSCGEGQPHCFSLTLGKEALTGPSWHLLLLPPGRVQKRPARLPAACGPRLLRAPARAVTAPELSRPGSSMP